MEETQTGFTLSDVSSLPSVSSGSEQSIDKLSETEADKKLRHVGYLIDEMTDTELTYISALSDVTEGYISKIRCGENTGFTDEMILEVFVNIEDIRRFHIDLHRDLVDCQRDHRRVAQLFISKTNVITEMYVDFCSAFPRSLEKLEELHDTEPSKSFLVRCQADLNHIFGVEEYLHRAIQRVLKYPLLFRDMSKKLRDQDGCDVVDEALSKVLVTAVKINAVKRVQELQSNELVGWTGGDMALMGDLLLEDTFKLVGAKDPRYLFLFKKCLLLTKKRENEGTFVLKNKVDMDNITLKEQVDGDFLKWSIFVGKGTESYTLQARDDDEKGAWTREVKRCIVYSTPGLSEDQKEDLLLKLPSLKNDCEQIARLWKRGTKKTKTKGAKQNSDVQIIHNSDKVKDSVLSESETTSTTETEDFHIKNSGFKNRRTAVKIRAPLEDISDLTYKSDITSSTEQLDSDLDNLQSDKEVPQLDTGADTVLSYVVNCSLNSRFYPQVLLFLIYLVACVFYFLPWYITYPTVIGTVSYSVYRRTCDNQTNM